MRLGEKAGSAALRRRAQDEYLAQKIERVGVMEKLKTLREVQSVSATE